MSQSSSNKKPFILFLFVLLLAALCYWLFISPFKDEAPDLTEGTDSPKNIQGYQYRTTPCWFDVPWPREVRCGLLRTDQQNGEFFLPVVIVKDSSFHPQKTDPLLFLNGGPGDALGLNKEGMDFWYAWFDRANLGRDLILVDQRGAGESQPYWDCSEFMRFSRNLLSRDVTVKEEYRLGYELLAQCFTHQQFSPESFSTHNSARDMRALMAELSTQFGYSAWNLYGISYGTRLLLDIISHKNDSSSDSSPVRAVILDSIYPPNKGRLQDWPALLDSSMQRWFSYCQTQTLCHQRYPEIEKSFWQAMDLLKQTPLTLTVKSWYGEAPVTVVVNDHRFLNAVFSGLYDVYTMAKLPDALNAVFERDSEALKPLIEPFINYALDPHFNSMVYMAVECADGTEEKEKDVTLAIEQFPQWKVYTENIYLYDFCHLLKGRQPEQLSSESMPPEKLTTITALPGLLLSGAMDPITPPAWAKELHQQWPQSQWILYEGVGHSVVTSHDPAFDQLRLFLDTVN